MTSLRGMFCGVTWCRASFIVYITTGNLLKETCSKKPLKICGCLLVLTITVCIVALVVATITTFIILHRNSSPFSVTTTFNSTVVVPLKKFIKSFSITSTRDTVDYSCTLAAVTLPCSALNKSYLRNQSVDDISNDLGNNFLYLLTGSIMHFRFDSDSNCPSYTLWVFRDKLSNLESTVLCTSLNEHKFKGECKTFMGSGTFDYPVPSDAYYFYTGYGCKSGWSKLFLTIDYYWYNFIQYVNHSGVQTVYIPPGQRREIIALSFTLSRMCTLIHTPSSYDCRAGHSFQSLVDISRISLHPVIWILCIVPIGFIGLIASAAALFLYTFCLVKEVKKVKRSHLQPVA